MRTYNDALILHLHEREEAELLRFQRHGQHDLDSAMREASFANARAKAEPYFVSCDIAATLLHAADNLPSNATIHKELLRLIPTALVLLEKPFPFLDDQHSEQIDGFNLFSAITPEERLRLQREGFRSNPDDELEHARSETLVVVVSPFSVSGSRCEYISTFSVNGNTSIDERSIFGNWNVTSSDVRIMRFIYCFIQFISQEILVNRKSYVRRATARRAKRSNLTINPVVNVVQLRRKRYEHSADETYEPSDREYSHQWLVRGHWRNQWYPSLGIHQPKWIAPYVKGPEDKPFKPSAATVHAVVR